MVKFVVFSVQNFPSSLLLHSFSELTRQSTNSSSVLKSKIPLMVHSVRIARRIIPEKCILLEQYLRRIGLLSGWHPVKFIQNNVVRSYEYFQEFLHKEKHLMFVALSEDNKVLGVLCMEPAQEKGMVYLHTLHVDPGYRRYGIATSLCTKAIDNAKEEKYIGVLTVALKESRALFARLGFNETVLNKNNYMYFMKMYF